MDEQVATAYVHMVLTVVLVGGGLMGIWYIVSGSISEARARRKRRAKVEALLKKWEGMIE